MKTTNLTFTLTSSHPKMKLREQLCAWLFDISKQPYAYFFKRRKEAWKLSPSDLLSYPPGTLAHRLGLFLIDNEFELLDKLESHDVFHVITGMSTTVKDELGMQFLLLGNGKRSVYMYLTIILGYALLPEYGRHYKICYKRGKSYQAIEQLDLKKELNYKLSDIRRRLKKKPGRIRMYAHLNDYI